jgi:hypothetical protein
MVVVEEAAWQPVPLEVLEVVEVMVALVVELNPGVGLVVREEVVMVKVESLLFRQVEAVVLDHRV